MKNSTATKSQSGWKIENLFNFINVVPTGINPYQGEKDYISTGSVQGKVIIPEGSFSYTKRPSRANRIAHEGDVFQARMKFTDKALLVDKKTNGSLFSTGFLQLSPKESNPYDNKLLYYFVMSPFFLDQRDKFATGSTQEALTDEGLKKILIPVPNPDEQKLIVKKLNLLLPKVQNSNEKITRAIEFIRQFKQDILSAIVSGELTENWRLKNGLNTYNNDGNPTGWAKTKLINVLIPKGIFDGPFGSNLKTKDYTDHGVRVIRLENVGFLELLNDKKTFISNEKYQNLKKHTVYENDLIFSSFIAGKIRCCVMPKLNEVAIAKADCFCLRPNKEMADVNFLSYLLSSKQTYDNLVLYTHGATRPRINTTQLRNLEILLPPLEEQKVIVKLVNKYFDLSDKIEKQIETAEGKVSKLTQAILAKTFQAGDLLSDQIAVH